MRKQEGRLKFHKDLKFLPRKYEDNDVMKIHSRKTEEGKILKINTDAYAAIPEVS